LNNIANNNKEYNAESFLAEYTLERSRKQKRKNDHIMLQITIKIDGVAIETGAMIDSRATANFVNKQFILENQLPMQQKKQHHPI
jgi:hypothetical protein